MLLTIKQNFIDLQSTQDIINPILAVLAIVLGIWATANSVTRRELVYWAKKPLAKDPDFAADTVIISLSGRGRHDISRDQFDGEQPIKLAVDESDIQLHGIPETRRQWQPAPNICTNRNEIWIKPGLIGRHQVVRIPVHTEGDYRHLTLKSSPLVDVKVRPCRRWPLTVLALGFLSSIVVAFGARWLWHKIDPTHHHLRFATDAAFWAVVALAPVWWIRLWLIGKAQWREEGWPRLPSWALKALEKLQFWNHV